MIERAPETPIRTTFDIAELYVMTCYHNGYSDWRFPHVYEKQEYRISGWNSSCYPYKFNDRAEHLSKVIPVRDNND
jgi:hypothetical protein